MALIQKHRKISTKKGSKPKSKKVRLAIECSLQERKYMKMMAAHEEKTLNEFVLESVRMRWKKCPHSHIPNKETQNALKNAKEKKDLNVFESVEDFFKSLEK
jgi:hypothetical protein